jgi:cytochrome c-type biogenesis protein CcmE
VSPKQKQRLLFVGLLVVGIGTAAALALYALQENVAYFFSPSEVQAGKSPAQRNFRLGGLVEKGSLQKEGDGLTIHFTVTDGPASVPVTYHGLLPDLFREGQGIVAFGRMDGGDFRAEEVLAKHDEKYMPPEAAEALRRAATDGAPLMAQEEAR